MPVFISHRKADADKADAVVKRLKDLKIESCIIYGLDPSLGDEYVTKKILEGLESCTHLLAIISDQTAGSWWVPFEIGVATEGKKRIVSINLSQISLPEYLKIWPIITKLEQLDLFVKYYNNDKLVLEKSYKIFEAKYAKVQTADDFHKSLKMELGQK